MKTCKLCSSKFPTIIAIDGVKRYLYNRKFCLTCSPFGQHNTCTLMRDDSGKVITTPVFYSTTGLICTRCSREYLYEPDKGHQLSLCNSCVANRRRVQVKERCIAYKGGKCIKCGYDKCPRALGFHHRDRSLKEFSLAGKMAWAWTKLTSELDKCDLLCANCHMEEEDSIVQARKKNE